MEQYVSRPAIATALNVSREGVKRLKDFPEPDAIIQGMKGRETYAWKQETVERWAEAQGREISWDFA